MKDNIINGIKGMGLTCRRLHSLLKVNTLDNMVVGITGPVGSGKTMFAKEFIKQAKIISGLPVITLPFDLWIDPSGLNGQTYAGRFFLKDFKAAVRCAKHKCQFLVPRYDLYRRGITVSSQNKPVNSEVFWEGNIFYGLDLGEGTELAGASGLYRGPDHDQIFSFFPNDKRSVYIADGTLIAQKELQPYYDLLIFVNAPWVNRVANMIRRFNRNEVFGLTTGTVQDYVQFLIDEARSCADDEVFAQLDQSIINVEYSPMNLSNYLDLCYLKELISHSTQAAHWVNEGEVNQAITGFLEALQAEYDTATLKRLRHELEHLALAKHLLCLENKDKALQSLLEILK